METYLEITPSFSKRAGGVCQFLFQVVLGSLFLTLCAKATIPIQPVPMTLQTLGVFLLAIFMGGKKASLATLFYLVQATLGAPVLAEGVNPLWIVGPNAGYLLAFPCAAYVIGMLIKKKGTSSAWLIFSILSGQLVIYFFGALFLSRFVGFKMSMALGVFPFLPLAGLKLFIAALLSGLYFRFQERRF